MRRTLPYLHKIVAEDHEWVRTIQHGPDGRLGHFDPYTGERVNRATGYPSPQSHDRSRLA